MTDHGDWMFFGGAYMWIIWIGLIVITLVLVKSVISNPDSSRQKDKPLDALKQRFAKGEISAEEFERISREIKS